MYDFSNLTKLPPGGCLPATLGIDFNDSTQPATFEVVCSLGSFNVCVRPTIGELLRPIKMDLKTFQEKQAKIGGMNEHVGKVKCIDKTSEKILECMNVATCESPDADILR